MHSTQTRIIALAIGMMFAGAAVAQDKKPGAPAAPAAPTKAAPAAAAAPPPAAAPAAAAPMGPPQPSKELEAFMKPFEGSWKCETKFPANAMGPGSPEVTAKTSVKFKKDLGGFFWRGEYEVKKQKGMPAPMSGVLYIGYDPGSKQALFTSVDSMGGMVTETGKIEGDVLNLSGEGWAMGQKMKVKETMGKKDAKNVYHSFEMDMGKGFMKMGEDTCKK